MTIRRYRDVNIYALKITEDGREWWVAASEFLLYMEQRREHRKAMRAARKAISQRRAEYPLSPNQCYTKEEQL